MCKKCQFLAFGADIRVEGKRPRAKPSWKSFSSSYGLSQLGSDSSLPVSVRPAMKSFYFKKSCITTPSDFQTFLWPCTIVVSYVCWCSKQLQWPLVITVYQNIHSLSMTILSRKTLHDFRTCTKQKSMTASNTHTKCGQIFRGI